MTTRFQHLHVLPTVLPVGARRSGHRAIWRRAFPFNRRWLMPIQLARGLVGVLREALEDEEPAAPARRKTSPMLMIPGGRYVYKATLVAEFNKMSPGSALPKDRITKVSFAAARLLLSVAPVTASSTSGEAMSSTSDDSTWVRPGSDIAMAFNINGRYELWIGRVYVLYCQRGSAYVVIKDLGGVRIDDVNDINDVYVTAAWYQANSTRLIYKINATSMRETADPTKYPITSYIGSPVLKFDPDTDSYSLVDGQPYLDVLDANLERTVTIGHDQRSAGERDDSHVSRIDRETYDAGSLRPPRAAAAAPGSRAGTRAAKKAPGLRK